MGCVFCARYFKNVLSHLFLRRVSIMSFIFRMRKLEPGDVRSLKFILTIGGISPLPHHACLTPNSRIISVPGTAFPRAANKQERSSQLCEAILMTYRLMEQEGLHVRAALEAILVWVTLYPFSRLAQVHLRSLVPVSIYLSGFHVVMCMPPRTQEDYLRCAFSWRLLGGAVSKFSPSISSFIKLFYLKYACG